MAKRIPKTSVTSEPVKGGAVINRDSASGRFMSLSKDGQVQKRAPKTDEVLKSVSERRRDALKRLADR